MDKITIIKSEDQGGLTTDFSAINAGKYKKLIVKYSTGELKACLTLSDNN